MTTSNPSGQSGGPSPAATPTSSSHGTAAPSSRGTPAYAVDEDVHLLDRIAVLYRYRTVAITVFILTSLAVMIQGYTAVQLYEAQAQLDIESERSVAVPGLMASENAYYEDPEPYFNTQF